MINDQASKDPTLSDVIKIAILAVGGQGGGVLTNWIADLATKGGYDVQTTSVAGVAQRTGATVYYIEMAPKSKRQPIFAQSPIPGDVDIMIAAELAEAGRAVLRGFVTPDRTTLIASTHRILAVSEKMVPGDGRSDRNILEEDIQKSALRSLCFDMDSIASQARSVISSALFGALAQSKALPFEATLFEEVIRASGQEFDRSVTAFRAALDYQKMLSVSSETTSQASQNSIAGPAYLVNAWEKLTERLNTIAPPARDMAKVGLRKVVDYQDIAYGAEYLEHLSIWQVQDDEDHGYKLTQTAAKYIANAMCYDDIIRVADMKTRASRTTRLRTEQGLMRKDILEVTEYFHPRGEEICATMPARLGAWFFDRPKAFARLNRFVNRGRRIRTDRLRGYLLHRFLGLLKPYRRALYRHKQEQNHLCRLQDIAARYVEEDYALAIEIFKCQRLIKGYSDTLARGRSKFTYVLGALDSLKGREDAAVWIARLRTAALKDETGQELKGALQTIQSFTGPLQ